MSQTLSQTPAPFAALAAKRGGRFRPSPHLWYGTVWPGCVWQVFEVQKHRKMSGVTNQLAYLSQIPLCERDRLVRHGLDPGDICDTTLCWGFCTAVHRSESCTLKRSETHVS